MLAVVSVPLSYAYLLDKFDVLTLIHKLKFLNVFAANQLHAQVLLQLHYYDNGILLASIFWGLWLFPLGYLVYKSGFLPKIIGVFLMVGCFGYLIDFLGHYFMSDKYGGMGISNFVGLPGSLGELAICLWLLIVGVKKNGYQLIEFEVAGLNHYFNQAIYVLIIQPLLLASGIIIRQ